MSRSHVERVINGHRYRLRPLGSQNATAVLEELLRVFGPTFDAAASGFAKGDAKTLAAAAVIAGGHGFGGLCAQLPRGALWGLFEALAKHQDRGGGDAEVLLPNDNPGEPDLRPRLTDAADDLWTGAHYPDMFAFLAWALEVNFAGFFGESGSASALLKSAKRAFSALQDEAGEESERPSTEASTG